MVADFNLYMEIITFMEQCGGPYKRIEPEDCVNLIESLENGQYIVLRGKDGKLVSFLNYWLVDERDIPGIRDGIKPADITSGKTVYVVDCCNLVEMRGIIQLMKETRKRHPDLEGGAWFHKRKTPDNFRYYPSQRGSHG